MGLKRRRIGREVRRHVYRQAHLKLPSLSVFYKRPSSSGKGEPFGMSPTFNRTPEPTNRRINHHKTAEPHLSNNTPHQSFQPIKLGTVHLGESAKPGTVHFVEEERIHAPKMQL